MLLMNLAKSVRLCLTIQHGLRKFQWNLLLNNCVNLFNNNFLRLNLFHKNLGTNYQKYLPRTLLNFMERCSSHLEHEPKSICYTILKKLLDDNLACLQSKSLNFIVKYERKLLLHTCYDRFRTLLTALLIL